MHNNVAAVLKGSAKVWGGNGVIDDNRHAVSVGDVGDFGQVDDVTGRIADGFAVDRLGFAVDQRSHGVEILRVGESRLDAKLRKGVRKEVIRTTVQR